MRLNQETTLFNKTLLKRLGILLFWAGLIFAALYFPQWKIFQLEQRSLNVFAWGDIFDSEVIAEFERNSGIKVNLNYYSSNEELIVKLRATGGADYDLIVPSDHAVLQLANEGLLKPLDHTKFDFWEQLNPLLLNRNFDPGNHYSIPFEWELFGLGINSQFFKDKSFEPSWSLIFKDRGYKVAMLNEPMQAVLIANLYLFGKMQHLEATQLTAIKKLLIAQKKWVEAYADFRGDYFLATGNCPVVVASSSYIWRARRLFPFIHFAIPKEGTLITIENLAIPIKSQKESLVYSFINALFRPDSIKRHFETYGFFPAALIEDDRLEMDPEMSELFHTPPKQFEQFYFFELLAPHQQVRDLWVELKT